MTDLVYVNFLTILNPTTMNIKHLLKLLTVLLVSQLMLGCGSPEYYQFAAHKPEAFNKVKEKSPQVNEDKTAEPTLAQIAIEAAAKNAADNTEPVLEASLDIKKQKFVPKSSLVKESLPASENIVTEAEALAIAKERLANMSKTEKKDFKKHLKEAVKQDRRGSNASIVEIVLAILIPPLAVFLHDGIGTSFWINIILTLLFVIPGIIHALLVVTDNI
jgi:uncharacterized membrane protein YqaE (UPF0057 family)